MNGEIVCGAHSVTVLSCTKTTSAVQDEKTIIRLSQEGRCSPLHPQQSDAPRQVEGRAADAFVATLRDSKPDFPETESSPPFPPQLHCTQTCLRPPAEAPPPPRQRPTSPPLQANNGGPLHQRRGAWGSSKGKKTPRRTHARARTGGKNSQNRKVTDFYPIRRSSRKSKTELKCEQKKLIDDLIMNGIEEGMEVQHIEGKGRAVFATQCFQKGDYVVEYHGDLLQITDAKKREAEYAQNPATGCYMYYFQYLCKTYCVDATRETGRLGRLINHSKNGNCTTKLHDINGVPHLILVASRDIDEGEELLYDYGDRSKASIAAHPWLKY